MIERFRPSGRTGPATFPLIVPGLAAAAGLGVVYDFLLDVIPLIYLDALVCIGAGYGAAYIAKTIARAGKCRNRGIGAAVGAATGLVTLATSFLFAWWWNTHNAGSIGFFDYIQARAKVGFSIGRAGSGIPIQGVFMYLLWIIEAGIILVIAAALGSEQAGSPFCESCFKWAGQSKFRFTIHRPSAPTIEAIRKAQGVAELLPDPAAGHDPGPESSRLEYEVKGCPTCDAVDHVNVDHKYTVIESKKPKEKKAALQHKVLIGPEELDALRAFGSPNDPAAPAPLS